jgi:hypothetical protein
MCDRRLTRGETLRERPARTKQRLTERTPSAAMSTAYRVRSSAMSTVVERLANSAVLPIWGRIQRRTQLMVPGGVTHSQACPVTAEMMSKSVS